jgi:hypothetical protein
MNNQRSDQHGIKKRGKGKNETIKKEIQTEWKNQPRMEERGKKERNSYQFYSVKYLVQISVETLVLRPRSGKLSLIFV